MIQAIIIVLAMDGATLAKIAWQPDFADVQQCREFITDSDVLEHINTVLKVKLQQRFDQPVRLQFKCELRGDAT